MRRRELLNLLVGSALGCSSGAQSNSPIRAPGVLYTRDDARRKLGELAQRYEALMRRHGEHQWSRYAGKLEERPRAEQVMVKLRADESELFAEAEAILRRFGRGVVSPRRSKLWQQGALGLKLLGDARAAELSDKLESIINGHVFVLDGRRIGRNEIYELKRAEDPALRRRTRQLDHELHIEAAPVALELLKRRIAIAHELGLRSFYDALLELRGITAPRMMALFGELDAQTRRARFGLLGELRSTVRGGLLLPWDLEFATTRRFRPAEERFLADRALAQSKRLYAAFGIDLDRPKLDLTIKDSGFGDQAISVHVPDDVRLVIGPSPGMRFWGTLIHELGHAYAATRTRAENALYAGYEWVPGLTDPAFAEGLCEVFARLLDEPRVLAEFVGLNVDEIARTTDARRAGALLRVPATLQAVAFERVAHERPDADLDRISLDLERQMLGVFVPRDAEPIWAASATLANYPAYTQSYGLAAMLAVQTRATLKERFGERWISPESGRHLTESMVADGARFTLDEKLIRLGSGPLRPGPSIEYLNSRQTGFVR